MSASPTNTNVNSFSYQAAMVQAYHILEQKFKEDPERTAEAFADALGGQTVDKHFVVDLENLMLTVTTIKKLFGKIHDALFVFDAEKYHDETGNVTKFAPKWNYIREVRNFIADCSVTTSN